MSFEEITILIALIMLIICFIVVIVMIYNSSGTRAFPVRTSRCPDFYRVQGDSQCIPTVTSSNMPTVAALQADPSLEDICKYKDDVLNSNGLLMDGITNRAIDCFDII